MEQWHLAYPHLDKFQINLAMEFDEMMAEKFGVDYAIEDHINEIFPDDTSVEDSDSTRQDDRQGEEGSPGDRFSTA